MFNKKSTQIFLMGLLSLFVINGLTACSGDDDSFTQPVVSPTVIEEAESDGGCDILSQEFGVECDDEAKDVTRKNYVGINTSASRASDQMHRQVQQQFPHIYSSFDKQFPLRGSWRQSKEEVMDLVDRHIWSADEQKPVELTKYFDMALLINVSPRNNLTPEGNSSQMMQVYVRNGSSNNVMDWDRIHVWPISSGLPGGAKIATFTGVYKFDPPRMYPDYYSNQFKQARMYESMFLYHQYAYQSGSQKAGVAIHGTYINNKLGRRDSGGCIRLARENAQCLYKTLKGEITTQCLDGGKLSYWGRVPSLLPRNGEADPEYKSNGLLEVGGYRVLVVIFNDENDKL